MNLIERGQPRIDHICCPAIEGLPAETVHMLHRCMLEIVHMQRSVERTELQIGRSRDAAIESVMLLGQLRRQGF